MLRATQDVLYRIHSDQASRRGQSPLSYAEFQARLRGLSDTDLTDLLTPPKLVAPSAAIQPKFNLGRVCITPNAAATIHPGDVASALARHARGDWGTLDAADWAANDQALAEGGRLVSAYVARTGEKFWIITDAGHEVTTVLLPEDY